MKLSQLNLVLRLRYLELSLSTIALLNAYEKQVQMSKNRSHGTRTGKLSLIRNNNFNLSHLDVSKFMFRLCGCLMSVVEGEPETAQNGPITKMFERI